MRRTRHAGRTLRPQATCALILLSLTLALGCETAAETPVGGGDVSLTDSGGSASLDAESSGVCGDPAFVETGDGARVSPVAVTSGSPVLCCCQALSVHFHSEDGLGWDVALMLRLQGAGGFEGTYDLAALPEDFGVVLWLDPADGNEAALPDTLDAALSGTLRVRAEETPTPRYLLDVCLTATPSAEAVAAGAPAEIRLGATDVGAADVGGGGGSAVGFYLLDDPRISATDAAETPLEDLVLAESPFLDMEGFAYYDLAAHRVVLSMVSGTFLRNTLPQVGVYGLPFVVVADGERIYLGAFWTMVSSVAAALPTVELEMIEDSGFVIQTGYPVGGDGADDPRSDPRLVDALRRVGRLVE